MVDETCGTVLDTRTGLLWRREVVATPTWADALQNCGDLGLAGVDDWRLATIKELQTLFVEETSVPAVSPVFLIPTDFQGDMLWSATPRVELWPGSSPLPGAFAMYTGGSTATLDPDDAWTAPYAGQSFCVRGP